MTDNNIYLVTLYLDTPVYLTDMDRDMVYEGRTFIKGKFKTDNAVDQKSTPSANDFSITFSAVDQTLISAIANSNYKGKRCLIQRVSLNEDETIESVQTWLDGELNKYSYKNTPTESTITLVVGSIFAAFEGVKMLNLNLQFADTINEDETLYWGKTAPTVTPVVIPKIPFDEPPTTRYEY